MGRLATKPGHFSIIFVWLAQFSVPGANRYMSQRLRLFWYGKPVHSQRVLGRHFITTAIFLQPETIDPSPLHISQRN